MVEQQSCDGVLITLASALRLQFGSDGPAARAVDHAVEHLSAGLPFVFDGVALHVMSASQHEAGVMQTTDGVRCTCAARIYPWCWHRAAYRLLLAQMSLREPAALRARICAQTQPADLAADRRGDVDAPALLARPFEAGATEPADAADGG
jgi:hypothetical protein